MKRILSFSGNQDNPHWFFYFNLVIYRPLIASNIRRICFFSTYECFIYYHFYDTFCLESDRKVISSIQKLEHRSLIIGKKNPELINIAKVYCYDSMHKNPNCLNSSHFSFPPSSSQHLPFQQRLTTYA